MIINSYIFSSAPSYTARTTAFATATAITDTTILNALNTFDLGLISNGLDTKMKAVYPMVGGTATTHKFNFMDARDLDVAFRLNFSGGMTHSSNGVLFNGTNGWADTRLIPLTTLSLNSSHASIYSRTDNTIGAFDFYTPTYYTLLLGMNFGGTSYSRVNQSTYSSIAATDSLGLRIINRTDSASEKLYKNNSLILTTARTSTALAITPIAIALTEGSGVVWSNRQYSFMTIGSGLTDGEASTLYTLTQAMQTSLSRQV
jgi:hypothetical protein